MNLSDLLPAVGRYPITFWLYGKYGNPKRANFWDLRAVLAEMPSEVRRRVAEAGDAILPATSTHALWAHHDSSLVRLHPELAPRRANYRDLRVLLATLTPEQLAGIAEEEVTHPLKKGDLLSALSSFLSDWGVVRGPRAGDYPRLSDLEELAVIFQRLGGLGEAHLAGSRDSGTLVRLKRSRFARSRTKVRLDQLASALGRLAAFANVSHTLEREALKGKVKPRDVVTWIEQALTSDWKTVFKLTDTDNVPEAISAVRRLVGRTPEAEKQLGDVADALPDDDWVPGAETHAQAVARVVKQRDEALALVNEARSVMFDLEVAHGHPILEKVRSRVESWCERAQALDIVAGPGGKGTKDVEEEA